jgi:hypothetical protein
MLRIKKCNCPKRLFLLALEQAYSGLQDWWGKIKLEDAVAIKSI